jgi:hypothetical protein
MVEGLKFAASIQRIQKMKRTKGEKERKVESKGGNNHTPKAKERKI